MIFTGTSHPANAEFEEIDTEGVVKGCLRDKQGRVYLVVNTQEIVPEGDTLDCDFCNKTIGVGVVCLDNREQSCLSCFNGRYQMNIGG